MIPNMKWFDRSFPMDLPAWMFSNILERLRGTPARLDDRVAAIPNKYLGVRVADKWSIQENVGHLLDLEPLWSGRLEDLCSGAGKLRAADLTNKATDIANHNSKATGMLLRDFHKARAALIHRLEGLREEDLAKTALHPRLNKPMTIIDKMFFIAEHDDHHLARMSAIVRECGRTIGSS